MVKDEKILKTNEKCEKMVYKILEWEIKNGILGVKIGEKTEFSGILGVKIRNFTEFIGAKKGKKRKTRNGFLRRVIIWLLKESVLKLIYERILKGKREKIYKGDKYSQDIVPNFMDKNCTKKENTKI